MKIVNSSHKIEQALPYNQMIALLESAARTCYKSEDRIKPGSAEKLIKYCIQRGHESVLEHASISVRFVCSRGISHELVRHRLASFSQESTRYCNYKGGLVFVRPDWVNPDMTGEFDRGTQIIADAKNTTWFAAIMVAETVYMDLISVGCRPEEARDVLPNALKTEMVMTANVREWRHILRLRCAKAAHPDMRALMLPLLSELQENYPVLFEDI